MQKLTSVRYQNRQVLYTQYREAVGDSGDVSGFVAEPFSVRISQTESSVAARLDGDYLLDITSDDRLILTPIVRGQVAVEWRLSHIRNFVLLPIKGGGHVLVMESGRSVEYHVLSLSLLFACSTMQ